MTNTLLAWHVTFADGHTSVLTVESCRVPYCTTIDGTDHYRGASHVSPTESAKNTAISIADERRTTITDFWHEAHATADVLRAMNAPLREAQLRRQLEEERAENHRLRTALAEWEKSP